MTMTQTPTLDKQTAAMYTVNKNVFFDAPSEKTSLPQRILRRLLARYEKPTTVKLVVTEQTVEYPLLFQQLERTARTVLDFGCVEGVLPLQLCALGYQVTGLDFRPYPFQHPNFTFCQADIFTWEPPENAFDAVVSISTVEHVGLGGYGDPTQNEGDKLAVQKLWRACRPGGKLYLSVPAGKPTTQQNLRVYDEQRLRALVPNLVSVRFFTKLERYGAWQETNAQAIAGLVYTDYQATAPVQAVAFAIGEKQ